MSLVLLAFDFAKEKHHGQVRKGSGAPYISHPMAVSYIVAAFKKSNHMDEILAACYLHDTLEDTNTDFMELALHFGGLVASLVLELSNDQVTMDLAGSKLEYHKRKLVGLSSWALVIKLADRLHNVSDQPSARMVLDTIELMAHLKKNRRLSKTHRALMSEILIRCRSFKIEGANT